MYDPILLALDGSKHAEQAIRHAVALARRLDSHLILLRVVPVAPAIRRRSDPGQASVAIESRIEQLMEREKAEAEAYIAQWVAELSRAGIRVTGVCRAGWPAPTIIDVSEEFGARLLVLATHGRSGPGAHAYGSVAGTVLQKAGIPVLLVPVADHTLRP